VSRLSNFEGVFGAKTHKPNQNHEVLITRFPNPLIACMVRVLAVGLVEDPDLGSWCACGPVPTLV
jgi:hypothetical protein